MIARSAAGWPSSRASSPRRNLSHPTRPFSSSQVYRRTANVHPILGVEYRADQSSPTDRYFAKMGMTARYFMPPRSVAPLAFYHIGDLVDGYTNLELASTISVMETFQKIYRPEIYNANSAAAARYQPSLDEQDYSLTRIVYEIGRAHV